MWLLKSNDSTFEFVFSYYRTILYMYRNILSIRHISWWIKPLNWWSLIIVHIQKISLESYFLENSLYYITKGISFIYYVWKFIMIIFYLAENLFWSTSYSAILLIYNQIWTGKILHKSNISMHKKWPAIVYLTS